MNSFSGSVKGLKRKFFLKNVIITPYVKGRDWIFLPSMLGKGRELNKFVRKKWKEHLVQLAPVKNTVLWVNPEFSHFPLKLETGKPTPLGLFAESPFNEEPLNLLDGKLAGEGWTRISQLSF